MLVFFTNLSYRISGQIIGVISSFLGNKQLGVVLDGKSSQEYLINDVVPQGSFLGPALCQLYINNLPDVMCSMLSMLMILLFNLCVIKHLISSNGQSWLLNLNLICKKLWAGTGSGSLISTGLVLLDQSNNTGVIDVKVNGSLFCGCLSFLNWIEALTLSLLLKLSPRKLEP